MADIKRCGLLVFGEKNQILLISKREGDTASKFIFPGGELREGEEDFMCLQRGIQEELSVGVADPVTFVGEFEDLMASDDLFNEKTVSIRLYQGKLLGEPEAGPDVAELVWYAPGWSDDDDLAPVLRNKIIPFLMENNYFE